MNHLMGYSAVALAVSMLLLLGAVMSFKLKREHEKGSPFECGFDPSGVSRVPFCMKFFLISIIFLVFDVEISLVFPMIHSLYQVLSFLLVLLGGLLYEWTYGGLQWMV
uniref:NADH-ubiquinone oxidoreductase chain 3 n=1 Tax=Parasagitta elegans TaxID=1562708 RepID=A0A141CLA4_9BILA|nr:NADH dehydrogenase subunit 3 [Parasagitta elegans]